jgi:hypothetical protein
MSQQDEPLAAAVANDLTHAEALRANPERYQAALRSAMQIHGVDPSQLQGDTVRLPGGWIVRRHSTGEWMYERAR